MKKLFLLMIFMITSVSVNAAFNYSGNKEFRDLVKKLKKTSFTAPANSNCDAAYCHGLYTECYNKNFLDIKQANPNVPDIENNMDVKFYVTAYCTVLASVYYSICKGDIEEKYADALMKNYVDAQAKIMSEAEKQNQKKK